MTGKPPGRFSCPGCSRTHASTWKGVLRRHYRDGAVCSGSGLVVIPDLACPTPARDFGSGAVDEMDPGPQTGGSGSVRDRSSPRAAGHPD